MTKINVSSRFIGKIFSVFIILSLFLMNFLSPPEVKAQLRIFVDSLKNDTHDTCWQHVVSPYSPIYIDIYPSGRAYGDTAKLYIFFKGEDSTKAQISMCENQITFAKDTLLIIPVTCKFRTWKVCDINPWAIYLTSYDLNGGMGSGKLVKFRIRGVVSLYNFKFPYEEFYAANNPAQSLRFAIEEKQGLKDYQLWLSQYSKNQITWNELVSLINGQKELFKMRRLKSKLRL